MYPRNEEYWNIIEVVFWLPYTRESASIHVHTHMHMYIRVCTCLPCFLHCIKSSEGLTSYPYDVPNEEMHSNTFLRMYFSALDT